MSNPPEMSPVEARDRWLSKRKPNVTDSTLTSLHYRLKLFADWCEEQHIDRMRDLTGWDMDEYGVARRENANAMTLNKELGTLKQWLEYCHNIGLVDESVPDAVSPPKVNKHQQSDDTMLEPERGERLLSQYRSGPHRASRGHVLLEILWTVGCRASGICALDVNDFDADNQILAFKHRPDGDTGLKNFYDGERMVGLLDETADVLRKWVDDNRPDIHDDNGRQPLLPSQQGRPHPQTIQGWAYVATEPCLHEDCPHDNQRETCDWTLQTTASSCPSSRSPHQIRTGSITWQRSRGIPIEVVAKRVDASVRTIKKHYDKEDPRRELEERRRGHLSNLEIRNDE